MWFERTKTIRFHHCDPAAIIFYPQYFVLFHELMEEWFTEGLQTNYGTYIREQRLGVPAVRAEQGCIEYGAAVDAEPGAPFQTKWGPDTFLVIEKWESMDHLKAHAASEHMKAYGAKTKDLLANRAVHVLQNA